MNLIHIIGNAEEYVFPVSEFSEATLFSTDGSSWVLNIGVKNSAEMWKTTGDERYCRGLLDSLIKQFNEVAE